MTAKAHWYDPVTLPALLRHARTTYGLAMRQALAAAGYDDIPRNGLYLLGGLAFGAGDVPLARLISDLRTSKQAAGQLVDTLVSRGYLKRAVDEQDRRRLTVTLTDRGRAAADTIETARKKIDAALSARAGDNAVKTARRVLASLIEIGHQYENPGHPEESA